MLLLFGLIAGGSGVALNERLGFAQKRMRDDPVDPTVAKIAAVALGQFRVGHIDTLRQKCAGFVKSLQPVLGHRNHCNSFHIAVWIISCVRQYFLHPVHGTGKAVLAILGQAFGKLEPGYRRMIRARADGSVRHFANSFEVGAGVGKDQTILGDALGRGWV